MTLRVTILGCGSSGGVPRIGGHWGACDPAEPKNSRRRCSILLEQWQDNPDKKTTVLIDTAPEMRQQLIDASVTWVDGVLYTHEHADQTHGIDDLRMIAINRMQKVDVYMDFRTTNILTSRFNYCFETPEGSSYPPILNAHLVHPLEAVIIEGEGGPLTAIPFEQVHGDIISLGYRTGNFAYSSDVSSLPEESFAALEGTQCWVVDALRYKPHPTHAHVEKTLSWIRRLDIPHGVLTNLHVDLDYQTLKAELPEDVEPAYDGMLLEF